MDRVGEAAAQKHLERHQAVQPDVPGLVDDAHAAPADLRQDFVIAHPPGERIPLGKQAGRSRLAVGRQGGVGQAVERPGGLLAPGTPFQVLAQILQLRTASSPRWKAASSAEVRHWRRGMGKPWRDQTATAEPPFVPETAARDLPILFIAYL
jgi:hypothetical protein